VLLALTFFIAGEKVADRDTKLNGSFQGPQKPEDLMGFLAKKARFCDPGINPSPVVGFGAVSLLLPLFEETSPKLHVIPTQEFF
jgi:hypothetical protein